MKLNVLRGDDFTVWVPFDDDGAEVELRHIPPDELEQIRKKATVRKIVPTGKGYMEVRDAALENELLGEAGVRNWRGFVDPDDKEFPFTPENCALLMRKYGEFAMFVGLTCLDIAQLMRHHKEEQEKNSERTSGRG